MAKEQEKKQKLAEDYKEACDQRKENISRLTRNQIKLGATQESLSFDLSNIDPTVDCKCSTCPIILSTLSTWNPKTEEDLKRKNGKNAGVDLYAFKECEYCEEWFCPFCVPDMPAHEKTCRANDPNKLPDDDDEQ